MANSPWFKGLARSGIVARCGTYLLLGYLANEVALRGRSLTQASSQGALNEVAS